MKINKSKDKIISKKINIKYIIPWLFIFFFVSIGYASFTTGLKVQTTAMLEEYLYNEVYISGVSIEESSGGASSLSVSYKDNEFLTSVYAPVCNSYVIYNMEVVNKTDQLVYLSGLDIKSMTNEMGIPTTGFTVEIIETSSTPEYIEPHATATIPLKIKNNCTTNDTTVNVDAEFDYSLYEKVNVRISSNVSDADIRVTIQYPDGGSTFHYYSSGTFTRDVPENSVVSWEVSKTGYGIQTGSRNVGTTDANIYVTLSRIYYLTVNATPSSVDVVCNNVTKNQYIITAQGSGTAQIYLGDTIRCSVGYGDSDYYYSYSNGTYNEYYEEFTVSGDKLIEVTLQEKPWTLGTYTNSGHTGDHQWGSSAVTGSFVNYHAGYYLIELFGADGGDGYKGQGGDKGNYGYVYGAVYLQANTTYYYSLGGKGENGHSSKSSNTRGGANGGGRTESGYLYHGGGGGGYSVFRKNDANGEIIMLAAGGGGGAGPGGSGGAYIGGDGGNGARLGTNATTTISTGLVIHGSNGITPEKRGDDHTYGTGGTTIGGYNIANSSGYPNTTGSYLQGGNGAYRGGGGGGGYYGGGAGIQNGGTNKTSCGAGGGGSSYISSAVNYTHSSVTNAITRSNPAVVNGTYGGAIIISFIGKTL